MTTIEDVIRIAVEAHDGMKDMVGNPAVAHVLAVGLMGKNPAEQKAGFLHDVVEDSDITLDDLRAQGVEEDVLAAVDLLTHRPEMSYEDYVKNIVRSRNETAIQVKLNDLHHNLHRAELALIAPQPPSRRTRPDDPGHQHPRAAGPPGRDPLHRRHARPCGAVYSKRHRDGAWAVMP